MFYLSHIQLKSSLFPPLHLPLTKKNIPTDIISVLWTPFRLITTWLPADSCPFSLRIHLRWKQPLERLERGADWQQHELESWEQYINTSHFEWSFCSLYIRYNNKIRDESSTSFCLMTQHGGYRGCYDFQICTDLSSPLQYILSPQVCI